MKSFEEWFNGVYSDKPTTYERGEEKAYNAGASEMRKSLKCDSCLKFEDCEILRSLSGNGFDESFFEEFGCVDHKQKEEKP